VERGKVTIIDLVRCEAEIQVVSSRRIVDVESTRGGLGFDLIFDDGSRLMLFATQRLDERGSEQPVISVGMRGKAAA